MVDRLFAEPHLAQMYDAVCPVGERGDLPYYLPLVLASDRVLDLGCGTGQLLHRARERGHRGRLTGVDPAHAMLAVARARDDVEWMLGDATTLTHDVQAIDADLVTYETPAWSAPEMSTSTLRFLDEAGLDALLGDAGFGIELRHGDWDGTPVTPGSPELITVATRL